VHYEGRVIRPPAEADSLLIQATLGCSWNRCTFCGAYMDKPFRIKPRETVSQDLRKAAADFPDARRVFLLDGDALAMPKGRLGELLREIRDLLPKVRRVSAYANAGNLRRLSPADLEELRGQGLSLLYMGLESGDETTLARVNKGATAAEIIAEAQKAKAAGMKLNVTVLLGLGGVERSTGHAEATARALSEMKPDYAAALTLTLIPGTTLHSESEAGSFSLPDKAGLLAELRTMIAESDFRGLFLSDHASNYLPLRIRMPRDRDKAVEALDAAIEGKRELRPEWMRGL
jgi:radical SAM superfamily enzyme YgiQ (UPF0313 family)